MNPSFFPWPEPESLPIYPNPILFLTYEPINFPFTQTLGLISNLCTHQFPIYPNPVSCLSWTHPQFPIYVRISFISVIWIYEMVKWSTFIIKTLKIWLMEIRIRMLDGNVCGWRRWRNRYRPVMTINSKN